jgi:hypothetical protein
MLYALRRLHNGMPPDLHLQLVKDPALWCDFVATLLLGALTKHDPSLRDRLGGRCRGLTRRRRRRHPRHQADHHIAAWKYEGPRESSLNLLESPPTDPLTFYQWVDSKI